MAIERQLSIFLDNRPGILAHVCDILSQAEINVLALSTHDAVDNAVVRILCDNPTKALLLLEQEEFFVLEQSVVVLEIENQKLLIHINIAFILLNLQTKFKRLYEIS